MDHHNLEPDLKGAGAILIACLFALCFLVIAFGAWAYYKEEQPVVVEIVSEEGAAKAHMIKELTGLELPPEVAKWANVTFSGTSVAVDTDSLNIWLGRQWKEKTK